MTEPSNNTQDTNQNDRDGSDDNNDTSAPPATAAAAAAAVTLTDEEVAKRWQTLEQLTSIFGFPTTIAEQAMDAVGYADATTCYNYILDQNLAADGGGPIVPIDNCPHIDEMEGKHLIQDSQILEFLQGQRPQDASCSHTAMDTKQPATISTKQQHISAAPKTECIPTHQPKTDSTTTTADSELSCPSTENWMCLHCGVVRCSRYQYGHAAIHWQDSQQQANEDEHCLAVSFSDLSVWCYQCQAYIKHPTRLGPILAQLERLKFAPVLEIQQSTTTMTGSAK